MGVKMNYFLTEQRRHYISEKRNKLVKKDEAPEERKHKLEENALVDIKLKDRRRDDPEAEPADDEGADNADNA